MAAREAAHLVEQLVEHSHSEVVSGLQATGRSESELNALADWFKALATELRDESAREQVWSD